MTSKPYWPMIGLLALLKFSLPLLLQSSVFELHRDEYLYYQQGLHIDWGYLENPPLLSYLGNISSWLGGSLFWLKFWPCLFGALTLIITCLLTAELGGARFAQFLSALCILTGAFIRIFSLFQPNILDIFLWTLSIYMLVRYIHTGRTRLIYFLCVALALGFLSKYSIVFVIAGLFLAILFSRHRKLFYRRAFLTGSIIAFLIILPNVLWQYNHNWPLVRHMKELQETQLQFVNPLDFIKDQLLYLLPVVFVWITGLVWLFRKKDYRFLFFTYFLVIIFLLLGRGKSYYALGIYPALLAAGAVSLERWTQTRKWVRYAIPALILILSLPFIPVSLPMWKPEKLEAYYQKIGLEKTGLLEWEDQRNHALPQDFADMLGWKELTVKAENFYNALPDSIRSTTIIFCRDYGQGGALKYYGKGEPFRASTISVNGSFVLWLPDLSRRRFLHLLYIGNKPPKNDEEVFNHFEKSTIIDSVIHPYSRFRGDKIIFYERIDSVGYQLAIDGLKNERQQFQR